MNPLKFQQREVRFLGTQTVGKTQLKTYYLTSEKQASLPVPDAQRQQQWLTQGLDDADFSGEHHLGFAIIHAADDGNYLLISTWCNANMLRHRVFTIGNDGRLQPLEKTKIIACVWELAVMFYERNCWIEQVMISERLEEANVQRYLQKGYSGWV